jgi:hypothetical protein
MHHLLHRHNIEIVQTIVICNLYSDETYIMQIIIFWSSAIQYVKYDRISTSSAAIGQF